jgi:UDP-glucose 4-epimerase
MSRPQRNGMSVVPNGRGRHAKRALVTGGAGFIGSHLIEQLLRDGYSVTALDNLSSGSLDNIAHLDDVRFVMGDTADEETLDELVAESDVVFHLAAAVGVRLILADPIESFRTNVLGTEAVLRAADRHRVKVLIASTSEVYGKVARLPQQEDDDVLVGPTSVSRWSYAACKMLDEFIGLAYARRGLPVVCFRLFNTVGPRQTGVYGMVVPRFVDAALRGDPLPVHGDGSQSRCFLHVRDAVSAIVRLERSQRAVGQVFNVGSTQSVTILELAERVLQTVQRRKGLAEMLRSTVNGAPDGQIELIPYAEAYPGRDFEDIPARQPSVEKLQAVTRWRAKHDLDDILRDVVNSRVEALSPVAEEIAVSAIA